MKFSITKKTFLSSLQKLQKVIPNKPQLPALASIHISVEKNKILLTATDLYLGIRVPVVAKVITSGKFLMPGKLLIATINSFPEGEIVVTHKGTSVDLISQSTKVRLQTFSIDEYPDFPEVTGESIKLALSDLLAVERYVLPSVSKDITRPVLTAVQLELATTRFRAVGTDGFRLSVFGDVGESSDVLRLLIPARTISEYIRLAKSEDISQLDLTVSQQLQQVLARIGETLVFSRLVEGDYPPFEQIIPQESTTIVTCDADELLDQVRRAHVLTNNSSHIVQFSFGKDKVKISTPTTTEGSFEGVIASAKLDGPDLKVAFNALYLLDMLKQFTSQDIKIRMTEPLKPVLFHSQKISSFLYVVMPFRVV